MHRLNRVTVPRCRCEVASGEEEGAVAMDQAQLCLDSCSVHHNRGPAVDASGQATVSGTGSSLQDNAGMPMTACTAACYDTCSAKAAVALLTAQLACTMQA